MDKLTNTLVEKAKTLGKTIVLPETATTKSAKREATANSGERATSSTKY